MRFWTIFKVAVVLGGTVFVIMAALIAGSDVNAYKTQIAAAIEAETGRKIVFGGDIAVTLGRTTTLTINDVQLANLPGGSRADMLRVAEATAEVDAWELRRGNIVIQRLELRGADVLIDIDKKGRTNFDFSSAVSAKSGNRNNDRTGFLLQHIGDIDVRDAKVTIHDARDGLTQRLSLQRFQLSEVTGDDLIRIAAKGRLETNSADMSFDLHGRTGSLAALIARDKRYPVDLRGTVAGMTMAAAGTIADPFAATGLALRIDVSATDLSPVARLLRAELPSAGPARLIASLSGNSETLLSMIFRSSWEKADCWAILHSTYRPSVSRWTGKYWRLGSTSHHGCPQLPKPSRTAQSGL